MKKTAISLIVILFLISGLILAAKSPWGQTLAQSLVSDALKKTGFDVQFEKIEGTLPSRIFLKGVSIRGAGLEITAQTVELELSLLRLFKKEAAFTHLAADQITWKRTETPLRQDGSSEASALSYPVFVQQFKLTNVAIPDLFTAQFEGRLRLGKKNRILTVKAKRPEFPESFANLTLLVQLDGTAHVRGDVRTPTLEAFGYQGAPDAAFNVNISAIGPWKSLLADQTNIQGRIRGTATPRTLPVPDPFGPFLEREWGFSARFQRNSEGILSFSNILAKSDQFQTKAKASFDRAYQLQEASFQADSDHFLSTLPYGLSGPLFASAHIQSEAAGLQAQAVIQIPSLTYERIRLEGVNASAEGLWANEEWIGTARAFASYKEEKWEASSPFNWAENAPLYLNSLAVSGPNMKGDGQLEVRPDWIVLGNGHFDIGNLQAFHQPGLFGNLDVKALFSAASADGIQVQAVHLDAATTDLYLGDFHTLQANLSADLSNLYELPEGSVRLDLGKSRFGDLQIQSANLETAKEGESWPYIFYAEGKWKHPLIVQSRGFWSYQNEKFYAKTLDWSGVFYNHPFSLSEPVVIEWSPEKFSLSDTTLTLANATLFASASRSGANADARLQMSQMPLDVLSLNPLETPVQGLLTLNASLQERNGSVEGNLSASVEQVEVGSEEKLNAAGSMMARLEKQRLAVKADLTSRGAPLLNIDASLPMQLNMWPWKAELLTGKSAKGRLYLSGKIEDFLDFFDLGTHRLEGQCVCNLTLGNSLERPLLEGTCKLENGSYVNYYTGTRLQNIQAELLADRHILYLRSFKALDGREKGQFAATGSIEARPEEKFPFSFDIAFTDFSFVEIDLINAIANGKIEVKGNREAATAKGEIAIVESQMTVPDHIPKALPNLQVVYKNPSQPVPLPQQKFPSYPLTLDLHVNAPENVRISGRGLNSEWKGDFTVGGTYTSIAAKGKLELIQGEFSFSSRTFKLTEGTLSLSGKEREMPYLNLAGSTETRGISIIARLKGPLNSPQITLQSAPPLPLSSIMSYLLFGQDLSEISGFQALQLATSIASFASQGPDILESTRRSLGLDRLRIIAAPGSGPESETVAIEAGKYVAEGVLVSFSQGAEDSSTNASIEVELKNNFVFQAESEQQQEQGKFTLKWTLNY